MCNNIRNNDQIKKYEFFNLNQFKTTNKRTRLRDIFDLIDLALQSFEYKMLIIKEELKQSRVVAVF
jgi:hypothetical protein